jgi:hypothetical protein
MHSIKKMKKKRQSKKEKLICFICLRCIDETWYIFLGCLHQLSLKLSRLNSGLFSPRLVSCIRFSGQKDFLDLYIDDAEITLYTMAHNLLMIPKAKWAGYTRLRKKDVNSDEKLFREFWNLYFEQFACNYS